MNQFLLLSVRITLQDHFAVFSNRRTLLGSWAPDIPINMLSFFIRKNFKTWWMYLKSPLYASWYFPFTSPQIIEFCIDHSHHVFVNLHKPCINKNCLYLFKYYINGITLHGFHWNFFLNSTLFLKFDPCW